MDFRGSWDTGPDREDRCVEGLARRRFVEDVTETVDDLLWEWESRLSRDSYPESWRRISIGLGGSTGFDDDAGAMVVVEVDAVVLGLGCWQTRGVAMGSAISTSWKLW